MISKLNPIALTHDIAEYGLKCDDIGVVVQCDENHTTFEVEFATAAGEPIALLTLTSKDIRPLGHQEILHVRSRASA